MAKQAKPKDFISDDEMSKLDSISGSDFISDDDMLKMEAPKKSAGGALQTGVEQFANTAALGYLPSLAGKIGQGLISTGLVEDPYSKLVMAKGSQEEKPKLDDIAIRDEINKEMQARLAEHPVAGTAGMIGGAIGSGLAGGAALKGAGLVSKGAQTAGLLGRTLKAGASGAAIGAAQNPGDVEGERSGLQAQERLGNAAFGGLMGAGGQLAGEAVAAGGRAIKKAGEGLIERGKGAAIKASGAMLKDFRQILGKGQVDDIANEMYNKKLIRPGANFESIAEESAALKQAAGKKIGDIYKKVGDTTKMSLDKDKIVSSLIDAVEEAKPQGNISAYENKMLGLIDDFSKNKNIGDVREVNEIIGFLDDQVNNAKRYGDMESAEQGLVKMRQKLRSLINTHVDDVSESLGDKTLGKQLREANKEYQNLATISRVSKDRVARESANRFLSPSDYGMLGTGALGGGALGALQTGDVEGAAKGAAAGALLGLGNKALRKYANPVLAKGAMSLGGAMESSPAIQKSIGLLQQANQSPGLLGAGSAALAGPRKLKNGK